ncbi:MAG TPA: MFS transporter [Planctomycetaceae bacterium]|nr:MFS transporter [Planctomycetaceae bacterium]
MSSSPRDSELDDAPTRMWPIVLLLMAYAALGHFNRISLAVAGSERLMSQFSVSETELGVVYSAFLLTYTVCMLAGGWLIDRIGPGRALAGMGWSTAVCVAATGVLGLFNALFFSLTALIVIRSIMGALSTPLHPGAARMVALATPARFHSGINGMVTGAALVGVASAYPVFGLLVDWLDWPVAFLVASVATLGLAYCWRLIPVAPCDHSDRSDSGREPWSAGLRDLLRNRRLMLLTLSYSMVGYFQYIFFYWIQHYFTAVLLIDKTTARYFATVPTLAMAVGMPLGGWLADRLSRRGISPALVPATGLFLGAALVGGGLATREPMQVVVCFALSMMAVGATEGMFWTTAVELGESRGGLSAALVNTGGNAGGVLAPWVTPLLGTAFGWEIGFSLGSLCCIAGGLCWFWIIRPQADSEAAAPVALEHASSQNALNASARLPAEDRLF